MSFLLAQKAYSHPVSFPLPSNTVYSPDGDTILIDAFPSDRPAFKSFDPTIQNSVFSFVRDDEEKETQTPPNTDKSKQ